MWTTNTACPMVVERKMICYKDKTFCPFYTECKDGEGCHRAVKPEVESAGQAWSRGFGYTDLIARFESPPECFNKI